MKKSKAHTPRQTSSTTDDVGFVGLGLMGFPMATNLLKRSPRLRLHILSGRADKNISQLKPANRVIRHDTLADLASAVRVCFTMLPMPDDVEKVLIGQRDSLQAGLKKGSVVIDCSTSSPDLARVLDKKLATRGCAAVDSPVSGSPVRAKSGTLSLMVGARPAIYKRVRPLLECLGTPTHIGPPGSGQITKCINQLIVGSIATALSEGILLGERAGINLQAMLQAVGGGLAGNEFMRMKAAHMIRRDFSPRFYLRYHLKDMNIVLDAADKLNISLPQTWLVREIMRLGVAWGQGDRDNTSVLAILERMNEIAAKKSKKPRSRGK